MAASEHALEPLLSFPASARMSHGLLAHPRTRTHRWRRQIVVVAVKLPRRAPLSPSGFSFVREQRAAAARAGPGPTCHRPQRTHQRTPAPRERQPGAWPHRSASLDAVTRADPKPSPPAPPVTDRGGCVSAHPRRVTAASAPAVPGPACQRLPTRYSAWIWFPDLDFPRESQLGPCNHNQVPGNSSNFQKLQKSP